MAPLDTGRVHEAGEVPPGSDREFGDRGMIRQHTGSPSGVLSDQVEQAAATRADHEMSGCEEDLVFTTGCGASKPIRAGPLKPGDHAPSERGEPNEWIAVPSEDCGESPSRSVVRGGCDREHPASGVVGFGSALTLGLDESPRAPGNATADLCIRLPDCLRDCE